MQPLSIYYVVVISSRRLAVISARQRQSKLLVMQGFTAGSTGVQTDREPAWARPLVRQAEAGGRAGERGGGRKALHNK